jgi:S1-C subfamily serine protease
MVDARRMLFAAALALGLGAAHADVDPSDAIVKIYTVVNKADYYDPWFMRSPSSGTGSGCIIKGKKILTNAHVVSDETFVQVRRYGEARRVPARVVSVSHEADLAVLTVDDPGFFEGIEPLEFGELPKSQDEVVVYGFPLGGDTLSTTKGVISRIEHQVYVHSSVNQLAAQIDAAINPGNSGGPVLMKGKIVGVVMQGLSQADNIGYMVPITVVKHFFQDMEDGKLDGVPSLGLVMQDLENPDLKRSVGMDDDQTGLLVINVLPGSPCRDLLAEGDVILSIEGRRIADDGTIEFRRKERTSAAYYLQEKQIGEQVTLEVLTSGTVRKVDVELTRTVQQDWLVPMEQYDQLPSYYIFGGLVFCPLTKNFLLAWGNNWWQNAPDTLTGYLQSNYPEHDGEQVVMMMKVLAADANQGYQDLSYWIVKKVDGKPVLNMKELIAAIEDPAAPQFVSLTTDGGQRIVLDRAKARTATEGILKTYRIPADRSADLKIESTDNGQPSEPIPAPVGEVL